MTVALLNIPCYLKFVDLSNTFLLLPRGLALGKGRDLGKSFGKIPFLGDS